MPTQLRQPCGFSLLATPTMEVTTDAALNTLVAAGAERNPDFYQYVNATLQETG